RDHLAGRFLQAALHLGEILRRDARAAGGLHQDLAAFGAQAPQALAERLAPQRLLGGPARPALLVRLARRLVGGFERSGDLGHASSYNDRPARGRPIPPPAARPLPGPQSAARRAARRFAFSCASRSSSTTVDVVRPAGSTTAIQPCGP